MNIHFFDEFDGFEQVDDYVFQYYDCVLKKEIYPYKIGYTVPTIALDLENLQITGYDEDGEETFRRDIQIVLKDIP